MFKESSKYLFGTLDIIALLKRLESLIRKNVIKGMMIIDARNDPTLLKNAPKLPSNLTPISFNLAVTFLASSALLKFFSKKFSILTLKSVMILDWSLDVRDSTVRIIPGMIWLNDRTRRVRIRIITIRIAQLRPSPLLSKKSTRGLRRMERSQAMMKIIRTSLTKGKTNMTKAMLRMIKKIRQKVLSN